MIMASVTTTLISFPLYIALLISIFTTTCVVVSTQSEVKALLSFKTNLEDPRGVMEGWSESTSAAPCDWSGILCDASGRVRELRLPSVGLSGQLTEDLADLRRLRSLSLQSNDLNGTVPRALGRCAQLNAVYLQHNSFSGDVGFFFNLMNLQVLNLAGNLFTGELSSSGGVPSSVRVLNLSSNGLSGEIPGGFTGDHQLQLLDLSFNRFSGYIPASIGMLQKLQHLWLDENELYGTVPSAITNCTSLVHVSAGGNTLSGVVPASIVRLENLQVLSLPRNRFTGVVPTSLLCANNASIRVLDLSFNELKGFYNIDNLNSTNSNTCLNGSAIEVLYLHGNQINGIFPDLFTRFQRLRFLDLSENTINGNLSDDFFQGLQSLEEFRVRNTSLTGEIPQSLVQCKRLTVFDMGRNRFSGTIPDFFGSMKRLNSLILGENSFTGSIPASLSNLTTLQRLDLSGNNLTGIVPLELMNLTNLTTLDLSNNRFSDQKLSDIGKMIGLEVLNMSNCGFSGAIPSTIGNLLRIRVLDLSRQSLSGELPSEIFGLPSLQVVSLEENALSGNVPEGFSSLSSLKRLNLSENSFSGVIPNSYGFLTSLTDLSLSRNRLNGTIPIELSNCSFLETLELRGNDLIGQIPVDFSKLIRLRRLDLGQNDLTSEIPETISNCSSLVDLLLDSNRFSSEIPNTLSDLSNLTDLNLASNNLTGDIPPSLALIPSLHRLDLSHNDLEGKIPETLASRFPDPPIYATNRNLCGKPSEKTCKIAKQKKRKRLILFITVASCGSLLLLSCFCGYIYSLIKWRNRLRAGLTGGKKKKKRSPSSGSGSQATRASSVQNGEPKLVVFNNKITYAETLAATRQFDEENVLNRGKYGILFKAAYADGRVLAIRRLPDSSSLDENAFRKEAEALGRVKHRNLTILRGYYAGPPVEARLLVYDYMPNGNLATLLQEAAHEEGGGHVLNWPMRHLIALGVARGLATLHSMSIVHGDLKPQNVLFDADFEAHVSEFGLDRFVVGPAEAASTSEGPVGTSGYAAPEAAVTGGPSREADVYSFGIVVLEILTGKRPASMLGQDEDIVKWVKRMLQGGLVSELLEPGLLELDPESSEWEEFLLGVKVGLLCTMFDPNERPSMNDVVFMLEGCRLGPEVVPSSTDLTSPP